MFRHLKTSTSFFFTDIAFELDFFRKPTVHRCAAFATVCTASLFKTLLMMKAISNTLCNKRISGIRERRHLRSTKGTVLFFFLLLLLLTEPSKRVQSQSSNCTTPSFGAATNYSTSTGSISVAVGDFNGDGKQDLAVSNSNANSVSVLLNNGTGGLGTATNYGTGTYPNSVVVGDFNSDGKPDLAVANSNSANISILLNNGTGGFGTVMNLYVGSSPAAMAVGDFNLDGKPDLAVGIFTSNYIYVFLGNGTAGFGTASNYTTGTSPQSIAVGDFNLDGKPDLAVANASTNNLSILFNNGAGGFATAINYVTGSYPVSVAIGDFNLDGKPDLAVANFSADNISILLNNGAGGFGTAANYIVNIYSTVYLAGAHPSSIAVSDFNGDGRPDLAVANLDNNNVSVFFNNGTSGFDGATNYNTGNGTNSAAVGDFNSDGRPDLATANYRSGNVSVLLNTCGAVALPVNLLNIKAYQKAAGVQVEWTAIAETNMDRYEVEKASDPGTFRRVGAATAKNTSNTVVYTWLDVNARSGPAYYRIKAVGKSSEIKYSGVARMDMERTANGIAVYPNPFTDHILSLSVNLPKGHYTIILMNGLGQKVCESQLVHAGGAATQTLRFDAQLTQGVYRLSVSDGEHNFVQTVVKQ